MWHFDMDFTDFVKNRRSLKNQTYVVVLGTDFTDLQKYSQKIKQGGLSVLILFTSGVCGFSARTSRTYEIVCINPRNQTNVCVCGTDTNFVKNKRSLKKIKHVVILGIDFTDLHKYS